MGSDQGVGKKIDELFRYRRIPQMLKLAGIKPDSEFVQKLKDLQESIYALDEYLEANWNVTKAGLSKHWKAINAHLKDLGLNRNEVVAYRKDIERYQAYELDMRDGKLPTQRPFRTTYSAKTCDVRLIRKLIYREAPEIKKQIRESDWQAYDLITEINDDVDDVYEDLEVYNGNRFLISLNTLGKRKTQSEFNGFLREIGKTAKDKFKKRKGKDVEDLAEWTAKRLEQTQRLLKQKLGQKKIAGVKEAVLTKTLKG